jgi:uncharacterized protein (UPF0212 family)
MRLDTAGRGRDWPAAGPHLALSDRIVRDVEGPTIQTVAHQVTCTNCGGADWLSLAVAVVALFVAFVSLLIAIKAYKIQSREHEAFLARAEIEFAPRTLPAAGQDGVVHLRGERVVRVDLGFRVARGRPAENVRVNILLPRTVLFWQTNAVGAPIPGAPPLSEDTTELLADDSENHWLEYSIGHVGLATYTPVWIAIGIELPDNEIVLTIHMRLKVIGDAVGDNGVAPFDHVVRVAY